MRGHVHYFPSQTVAAKETCKVMEMEIPVSGHALLTTSRTRWVLHACQTPKKSMPKLLQGAIHS
jgi:hypothetical protein